MDSGRRMMELKAEGSTGMDHGHWTMEWTTDNGRRMLEWTIEIGQGQKDVGMDHGQWTMVGGQCTMDIGQWYKDDGRFSVVPEKVIM